MAAMTEYCVKGQSWREQRFGDTDRFTQEILDSPLAVSP